MATTKGCRTRTSCRACCLLVLLLWTESSVQLFDDLIDHDFGTDRALMRKVEAEVDRCLSHFCFQVACLAKSALD